MPVALLVQNFMHMASSWPWVFQNKKYCGKQRTTGFNIRQNQHRHDAMLIDPTTRLCREGQNLWRANQFSLEMQDQTTIGHGATDNFHLRMA
jgi:hypothetical protein